MTYRADIDGLRAIAVLAVLVYHLAPSLAPGGFVGVDVFFVISGFLITGLTLRRLREARFSLADFFARRVLRLLPAVSVVVLCTLLVGSWVYGDEARGALGAQAGAASLFSANLHFYATADYFTAPTESRPLLHLWSLGIEEQFYLLAPLGLMAVWKRPRALAWGIAGLVSASLAAGVVATDRDPSAAFYLLPFRAWELGLGALIAVLPVRRMPGAAGLGLAAIAGAVFGFDHGTAFPGVAALVPTLGAAAVLVGRPGPAHRLLSIRPLRAVGRWSYSIYLWHWPLVVFFSFLLMRGPSLLEAAGLGVLSIALGAASHRFVETPFRHVDIRAVARRRAVLGRGGLVAAGTAVLGASIWLGATDPARPLVPDRRAVAASLDAPDLSCAQVPGNPREVSICGFGAVGDPVDVVAWGDSHAAALAASVERAATAGGLSGRVAAMNGCPPLLGVQQDRLTTGTGCAAHNEVVFDWIARKRPQRVVLHGRWPLYAEGTRVGTEAGPPVRLVSAANREREAGFATALQRTAERLQDLDIEVVVVDSVPEVAFHVSSVWERADRLGLALPVGPSRADLDARNRRVAPAIDALTGIVLLQPQAALCAGATCTVFGPKGPLYVDGNHLSRAGARRLEPMLRAGLGVDDVVLLD